MKNVKALTVCGILGMAGVLWMTGCTAQPAVQFPDVLTVQTMEESQNGQAKTDNTVTVQAKETVKVTPDMAKIDFWIRTEDSAPQVCQQENTKRLDEVLRYLKEQGVEEESIQTSEFSLDTIYDWSSDVRTVSGYEMRTQVTVTDVPVEKAGALLSGVIQAGANEIQSVSYFASNYDEAYEEALEKAMNMALTKAEALAHAGGCQVTQVLKIEEYGNWQTGRYVTSGNLMKAEAAMDSGAADMAVMPGQMEIEAQIQVVYRLQPR